MQNIVTNTGSSFQIIMTGIFVTSVSVSNFIVTVVFHNFHWIPRTFLQKTSTFQKQIHATMVSLNWRRFDFYECILSENKPGTLVLKTLFQKKQLKLV